MSVRTDHNREAVDYHRRLRHFATLSHVTVEVQFDNSDYRHGKSEHASKGAGPRDHLWMTTDTAIRLHRFADLLIRWNATLNLIAVKDAAVIWERHIADSLQLMPLIPSGTERAIDLGSGGGFPGLVLAVATGVRFDLIESDRRKAAFLRTAILEIAAPAVVHNCRIEDALLPPAPLITARALAPLSRLLPLAVRLLAQDVFCLFLKGIKVEEELTEIASDWTMTADRIASKTSPEGVVLRLSGLRNKDSNP